MGIHLLPVACDAVTAPPPGKTWRRRRVPRQLWVTLTDCRAALLALERRLPALSAMEELEAYTAAQLLWLKKNRVSRSGSSSTYSASNSTVLISLRMMITPFSVHIRRIETTVARRRHSTVTAGLLISQGSIPARTSTLAATQLIGAPRVAG